MVKWNPNRREDGSIGDCLDHMSDYWRACVLVQESSFQVAPVSVEGASGLVLGGFDSIIATWIASPSIGGGAIVFVLEMPSEDRFSESFTFDDQIDAVVAEVPASAFHPANIELANEVNTEWSIFGAVENPSDRWVFDYPLHITLGLGNYSVHLAKWDDPTFLLRIYRLNAV
jgi:hypothetical protein